MLKFYIYKEEEANHSPQFEGVKEFEDLEDFLKYANYHRPYLKEVRTIEGDN
jgi:hypothetical protein